MPLRPGRCLRNCRTCSVALAVVDSKLVTRLIASTQGTDLLARYAFILQWLGLPTSVEVLDAVAGITIKMADWTCQQMLKCKMLFFFLQWLTGLPNYYSPRQYCQQQQLSMCSILYWSFPPLVDVLLTIQASQCGVTGGFWSFICSFWKGKLLRAFWSVPRYSQ